MNALSGHRQPKHACAARVEHCVSDYGSSGRDRRLSAALWRQVVILDEYGLDLRYPREARDVVGIEIPVKNVATEETQLLRQGVSETHGNRAFDLHLCALGIHDDSHICLLYTSPSPRD